MNELLPLSVGVTSGLSVYADEYGPGAAKQFRESIEAYARACVEHALAAQPAGVGAIAANLRGLIADTRGRPFTVSERASLQILAADLTRAVVKP